MSGALRMSEEQYAALLARRERPGGRSRAPAARPGVVERAVSAAILEVFPAPPDDCLEEVFGEAVRAYAKTMGWLAYHTHDSRRSDPGWPDWVFCRPPRIVIAELKTASGRPTKAQARWIAALQECPGMEVRVWRPRDWSDVLETLR